MRILTFLHPYSIPAGQARLRKPNGDIQAVDAVPEWYWPRMERIVARTDVHLGGVFLYSYFTCREAEDGTLFNTVYSLSPSYREWQVIGRHHTAQDACEAHLAIRQAWWQGREEDRLPAFRNCEPSTTFEVPPHPLLSPGSGAGRAAATAPASGGPPGVDERQSP